MAAASIYGACRCNGRPRTLDDVTESARLAQSRVTNAYTTLNTEFGLPAQPVTPSAFVPRLASELDVSDRVRHRSERLAAKSEATRVTTSVHPPGFAAACLYRVGRDAGRRLTQSEVAAAANVSATTIRNHRDALDEVTV